MLIPNRLANKSVTRRPSIKLKITPHMHPKASPLKNMASTFQGTGSTAKNTNAISAIPTENKINPKRASRRNSEMTFIPANFAKRYPRIWTTVTAIL